MPFKKGQSGNPRGRPVGTSPVSELRAMISERIPEVIEMLVEKAIVEKDVAAARILLDRVLPKMTDKAEIELTSPDTPVVVVTIDGKRHNRECIPSEIDG